MNRSLNRPLDITNRRRTGSLLRRVRLLVLGLVTVLSWIGAQPSAFGQSDAQPAGGAPAVVPAARQADNVAIITIHGPIDIHTARSVERRIALAEQANANAIVIDLNTPGGEVGSVIAITDALRTTSIANTVAWINPDAISGGAIIALACREIVFNEPARMGDALVITVGLQGMRPVPPDLRPKILSPVMADVINSARRNGYDEYLVQGFVSQGIELWQVRDTRTGQLLTINEAEYRTLFDGEPIVSNPLVVSVGTGRTITQGRRDPPAPPSESQPSEPQPPESRPAPPTLPAPTPAPSAEPDDESDPDATDSAERKLPTLLEQDLFTPATSEVADLTASVNPHLSEPTRRPTITPADRGHFEFVRYVTTGDGPLVLTGSEARALGLGTTIIRNDQELQAFFGAQHLRRLDANWSEHFVRFMTSLPVRGLLIVVFILGFFIEMTSPGLAFPGTLAAIALVGLIAPPFMVGMAGWWEVAAVSLGIILILCEIIVLPGFGIFGILGLLLFFAGLVGTFVANNGALFLDSPQARSDMLFCVATVALAVITSLVGMWFISKHFATIPLLNRLVLQDPAAEERDDGDDLIAAMGPAPLELRPGDVGVATTPLRPGGTAEFNDQFVEATADLGYIDAGTRVRVLRVETFGVVVEPIDTNA